MKTQFEQMLSLIHICVSYKKQYDNKEQRVAELLQYSNILEKMEKEFEKYNDHPVEM